MRQNWFKVSILAVLVLALVYFGVINMYTYKHDDTFVIRINKFTNSISVWSHSDPDKRWQYPVTKGSAE